MQFYFAGSDSNYLQITVPGESANVGKFTRATTCRLP